MRRRKISREFLPRCEKFFLSSFLPFEGAKRFGKWSALETNRPTGREKPLLNIRMLEQIPSAQSRCALSSSCFIIAFQLCDPDESFFFLFPREGGAQLCVRQGVPYNFPKTRHDRSSSLGVTAPREITRAGSASARGDLEKLSNRSCVYTPHSIFSCSNSLPSYYSLPLIIIANWSLVLFSPPSSVSLFAPSSRHIMKTVPWLWQQLPSFARGNHGRFSEDFAPWPGRVGRCRLLVFLRLFVSYVVH